MGPILWKLFQENYNEAGLMVLYHRDMRTMNNYVMIC